MKTGIKVFLGFTTGLVAGAAGAGIGLNLYYKKQIREEIIPAIREDYEERISALEEEMERRRAAREAREAEARRNQAIKEAKEAYAEYCKGFGPIKPVAKGKKVDKNEKVKVKNGKKTGETKIDTNKTDYNKCYSEENGVSEGKKSVKFEEKRKNVTYNGCKIDEIGHVYSNAASKGKPYIITMDEYTDMNGYDKQTYSFWTYDEVFVDEHDEPDLNICMYIGHDLMDLWHEYAEDESLFVRNDQQHTDYEIVIHDRSYAEYMREPDFDE